jgi:hypothetical protein
MEEPSHSLRIEKRLYNALFHGKAAQKHTREINLYGGNAVAPQTSDFCFAAGMGDRNLHDQGTWRTRPPSGHFDHCICAKPFKPLFLHTRGD